MFPSAAEMPPCSPTVMAARRKHFAQAGGGEARLGQTEGGAQPGSAGTDDHHIISMIDKLVATHRLGNPNTRRKIAKIPAPPASTYKKRSSMRLKIFMPLELT